MKGVCTPALVLKTNLAEHDFDMTLIFLYCDVGNRYPLNAALHHVSLFAFARPIAGVNLTLTAHNLLMSYVNCQLLSVQNSYAYTAHELMLINSSMDMLCQLVQTPIAVQWQLPTVLHLRA